MQRVRLRRTALRATPRMNTSTQPPEGAGGSRSKAAGELTLGLMSGEERVVVRRCALCRSEPARDERQGNAGIQEARVIVDDHRRNAARSRLAPTGALVNGVDLVGIVVADVDPGPPHFDIVRWRPDSRPISLGCTCSHRICVSAQSVPNTFFARLVAAAAGFWRMVSSCLPIISNRPFNACSVT